MFKENKTKIVKATIATINSKGINEDVKYDIKNTKYGEVE